MHLSDEQVVAVKKAFLEHPDWPYAYLFYNGQVVGPEFANFKSRTEQLASIATVGIPVLVGRKNPQLGGEC